MGQIEMEKPGASGSLLGGNQHVAAEALPAFSPRRPGKKGGVRFKRVVLDPEHWDIVKVDCDPLAAARWFKAHEGELYDWQLILGFVSWVIPQKSQRWTCSESAAAALGMGEEEAWRFDPANLHAILQTWSHTR